MLCSIGAALPTTHSLLAASRSPTPLLGQAPRERWKGYAVMADREDVRRIALALPDTSEAEDHFAFSVLNKGKQKGFVWAWNERVEPKKPKVPSTVVVAVRVADQYEKDALLGCGEEKFFTEPHYNGFPAVLVRLPLIDVEELEELIMDAWRCQAPRALADALETGRGVGKAPAGRVHGPVRADLARG